MEDHVYDLIPGYALGCLDDEELQKVNRHLSDCALCQEELETYRATVDQMAQSLPVITPPLRVKNQLMAKVTARTTPVVAAMPVREARQPSWWQRITAVLLRPAAVGWALAVILLVALGINNLLLWQQVNDLQARLPKGGAVLVNLAGTDAAPQTRGYLMAFPNHGYGTLVVDEAPPLPAGYAYQLWLIRDGKRTSGGVFTVNDKGYGTLQVWAKQPLDTFPSFGVTIEPEGGSPGPTGKKVLGGDL